MGSVGSFYWLVDSSFMTLTCLFFLDFPFEVWSAYNFDSLSYLSVTESYDELFGPSPRAVISRTGTIDFTDYLPTVSDETTASDLENIKEYLSNYILSIEANRDSSITQSLSSASFNPRNEPLSVINYPIINFVNHTVSFYDNYKNESTIGDNSSSSNSSGSYPVVGLLTVYFFWRDLIRNILPPESDGMVCVLENGCNQSFTYEINGPDVVFLGPGDLHDISFSHMMRSRTFAELAQHAPNGRQYTGVPLGGKTCPYVIKIFPSVKTEAAYESTNPLVFTVCAILIFLFTSGVFLVYDVCVEKRQQKVMDTAIQSSENVSLLEQMVKERTHKLVETNTRLEEANRRVTRASAAQLEHFACMSHEIRTPLNCIIGLSSLLLDTELNSMQEESMRMIVTSGDLLLTVVNDVLDYSKLESGNVSIKIVRSNLQDTLGAVVQSIEARARPKSLTIRAVYDPRIGENILMDCRRLQQILYNLLGNAVKFSNPGGTIDLTVSLVPTEGNDDETNVHGHTYVPKREDEVLRTDSVIVYENLNASSQSVKRRSSSYKLVHRTSQTDNGVSASSFFTAALTDTTICFVVKDCGKGIERKDFKKIFEPFRQASSETERVYGGTGLGLAVTAKLVTGFGGSISVDSCEGEWSEFTVRLPYRDTPCNVEQLTKQLNDTTILLIDDNEVNVQDVSNLFQQCHISYICYATMDDMAKAINSSNLLRSRRTYICLSHELLYEDSSYRVLADQVRSVLLTFGPKYCVKESKGHYRSLTQILPSVLLGSFNTFIDAMLNEIQQNDRNPSETEEIAAKRVNYHRSSSKLFQDNPEDIRIMMAEDNIINQKVLLRILTRLGYKNVVIANNGKEACDEEEKQFYDVILMDVQMPIMSGIEACRIITTRTTTNHPKPKIVFVTAHVSDAFEAECRNAGGADFLPKPFNITDIQNCLQRNKSQ
jgi:signal transduction histidine kinase/CheY-like chemotaxis protein